MFEILDDTKILNILPERKPYQNKGDFGHVLVIGGSLGMAGSVCMTAESALRSGAGLVTVAVPDVIAEIVSVKLTECMVLPLKSENGHISSDCLKTIASFLPKVTTVVVGMGGRVCAGLISVLEFLLEEFNGTLIVDADGLNILAKHDYLLSKTRKCELILTPHPKEMSRLLKTTVEEVQDNREEVSKFFSEKYDLCLVLKGQNTLVSYKDKHFLNPTGNVGMAKGGSGDVLAGMIAGFSAQGALPLNSSCLGVYLHGLAGDIAVLDKTVYSLIATDIISHIPNAIKKILGK